MIVVFPMAGRSQRFTNAGYTQPKFKLPIQGATMFDYALEGFRSFFDSASFLFVTRDAENASFAEQHARQLGVRQILTALDRAPRDLHSSVFTGLKAHPRSGLRSTSSHSSH